MPRVCTVCDHADLVVIDAALVAGRSFRAIACQYSLGREALRRHKADHLTATLAKAKEAQEAAKGDDLLGELRKLQKMTLVILNRTGAAGNNKGALMAIREARANLELLGKLLGQLREAAPVVNVLVTTPEWLTLQGRLLAVLDDHPEAKRAVVEAWDNGRIS
jgi:hypothetical protein